jgi:hypothetical protein
MQDENVVEDEVTGSKELIEFVKPVSLVVIDTLSRSLPGGDENDAEAMTVAIQNVDRIRENTKAAVLVVHHQTKDSADDSESSRERGSSTLRGAADVMLHMSTKKKILTVNAARDFESGTSWGFTIKPVLDSVVAELSERLEDTGEQLGTAPDKVLASIKGIVTTSDVVDSTGLSMSHTVNTLRALIAKGLVVRVAHGEYKLAAGGLDSSHALPSGN